MGDLTVHRATARILETLAIVLTALAAHAQTPQELSHQDHAPERVQVGPTPDGGFLLNTGWQLHPAGTTIPLSTLPMSVAPSPDGQRVAVLNGGYLPASVDYLDMRSTAKVASVSITDGWRGLSFSKDGTKLYAGNGA